MKRIDLTGQQFGKWAVLHYSHTTDAGTTYWECRCECGHQKTIATSSLRQGRTRGCRACNYVERRANLVGQRFGKWRVIDRVGPNSNGDALWRCHCDCGTERDIVMQNLTRGYTTQCRACANRSRNKKEGPQPR